MTLVVPYKLLDEDAGLVQIWGQVSAKLYLLFVVSWLISGMTLHLVYCVKCLSIPKGVTLTRTHCI